MCIHVVEFSTFKINVKSLLVRNARVELNSFIVGLVRQRTGRSELSKCVLTSLLTGHHGGVRVTLILRRILKIP